MTPTFYFRTTVPYPKYRFWLFFFSFKGRRVEIVTFQEFCRSPAILKSVLLASVVWYYGRQSE